MRRCHNLRLMIKFIEVIFEYCSYIVYLQIYLYVCNWMCVGLIVMCFFLTKLLQKTLQFWKWGVFLADVDYVWICTLYIEINTIEVKHVRLLYTEWYMSHRFSDLSHPLSAILVTRVQVIFESLCYIKRENGIESFQMSSSHFQFWK